MRVLALILLSASALAQERMRSDDSRSFERYFMGARYAFFEFAPLSGSGMGTACACTTPTGAKGEAMTFTRASSGTCLKGNTTTGVANGDMVTCSTNQPRVMPGGDGSGPLGLLVEATRTNAALWSEDFTNVAWAKVNSVAAAPGVAGNQVAAPDGTVTADWISIAATSGTQYSLLEQVTLFTGSVAGSASCWVKNKNAGSGQTCLAIGSDGCLCNFTSATWTRCVCENKTPGSSAALHFGNYSGATTGCNGVSFAANDVYLWGCQAETGGATYATSYIATTSAAVTRAADASSHFTLPVAMSAVAGSHAATIISEWSTGTSSGVQPYLLTYDSSGRGLYSNGDSDLREFDGLNELIRATTYTANAPLRFWSSYSASTQTVNNGSGSSTGTFDGTFGAASLVTLCVGNGSDCGVGPTPINGVIKQVCADPSPMRCR